MTTTVRQRIRSMQVDAIRQLCVKWEPLTGTDWTAKYRYLPETSTSPGKFDPDVVPYARRPLDLLCDPDTPSPLVLCWAAQMTKSTVIENALGYRIHRQPSPLVVAQPKIDAAEAWVKEKFVPMVLATPVLRERVRLGRSTDSTLRYKRFLGGFLFVASAQSATELASRSAPFVFCDEVDRFEIIPGEGNPVEIVARRQGAADVGLLALTSTTRDAETSIIWPYLEGGTFELYELPCPVCDHRQPLEFGTTSEHGLKWPKGQPKAAVYICRSCSGAIEERSKRDMLHAGDWVATEPEHDYYSFHLNSLYSPFAKSGWSVLATEWERAQGKPADLSVFYNTRRAECWAETTEVTDPETLLGRLEPMTEGVVPDGVGVLTAGGDLQHNRIEVSVWGWGAGLESWLITHIVLDGDPQREPDQARSIWRRLDEVLLKKYPRASGGAMSISASLIDSGFATSQCYRYTRSRRGHRINACKGVGGEGIKVLGKPTLQGKERVVLYPVGTDEAKREFLRSQILERVPGPGYVHLPSWLTSDQCAALVGEKRVRHMNRGRPVYSWVRKRDDQPNEPLDCRIYARGALEYLGPVTIANLGAYAEKWRQAAAKSDAASEQPIDDDSLTSRLPTGSRAKHSRHRNSGYVQRWRQ